MSEDRLHLEISQAMRMRGLPPGVLSPGGLLWYSVEHRNARSRAEGAARKARGVIAGLADCWLHWGPPHKLLCVELKTAAGALSPDQKKVKKSFRDIGVSVEVVRNLNEWWQLLDLRGVPLT